MIALTKREVQVIQLACTGLEDKQIADIIGISWRTVGTHLGTAYRKIGVSNRKELQLHASKYLPMVLPDPVVDHGRDNRVRLG